MKKLIVFCSIFLLWNVAAQSPRLLPKPQIVRWHEGAFFHQSSLNVTVSMVNTIEQATVNQAEAYRILVRPEQITIEATTEKGVFWAKQTLAQLIAEDEGKVKIPNCEIIDWPAFSVRGFMHDVGRTFIPLDALKKQIDLLSKFKINVFHWHLTEDLAWRLESKVRPELNDSQHMIRDKGKFYTQDQARELVAFCKERNVLLIPEIDMPGHSLAFRKAIGYDMQSQEGMAVLKEVIDEVCQVFDVPYLHIGTDEVVFTNPDFVPEMVAFIRQRGKQIISWNPGWPYKAGEADLIQLWSYRGKIQKGIPAIDSRFHYLNHFDTFGDIIALYNSKIYNKPQQDEQVVGSIMAVWNDRYVQGNENILDQNNFYPNMLAFAERTWRGGGTEYFDKNGTLLKEDEPTFSDFLDFEERMLFFKKKVFANEPFTYVKQTDVKWLITAPFPNEGNLKKQFPPEKKIRKQYKYANNVYDTYPAVGAGIYLRHVWGDLIPAFYENPQENHTAYAQTYVYSPKKQTVGLWAEFQNYSRSEKDLPPPQGKWDYKESNIFINNKPINPPIWNNTHTKKDNEIPLGNENFVARPPIPVRLKKGWNKVLVKLPVGKFKTEQIRLVKWMFTVVFVTLDTRDTPQGLIYSPYREKNER
ncbi:family 20 glycosylhydrolase [Capnocytophaga canimorsus]|uniref:family 20 glycosylhydrolase n=1 Tax=Capnocytophaga canimorsus TaxID=28188 RepID=UPI001AC3FCD0|nr:family 20 glycosylhydrolase [Capnocytophaga canimorsus]GIM58217.1 beta-N-acetylhexosaminidase [Capnocytophaga canimorsus]